MQWYQEPMVPPLVMYDDAIGETMRHTMKPTVILFRPEDDEFEEYAAIYKRAALQNYGRAIFIWADKDDPDGVEISKHMKVVEYNILEPGGPVFPSLRILWIYKATRYIS